MYYVYQWINPETKEVFYVGKGKYAKCYNRALNKHHAGRCENKRKKILSRGYKNEDIVQLVADNLTEEQSLNLETELIKKYGIIEEGGTLFNFRKNGTETGSYQKYRDADIKEMIRAYENGNTLKHIGSMYNIHECTVRKYLLDKNIKLRPQGYTVPKPDNWLNILQDITNGYSISKVSKKYDICYPTLKRLLTEHPN